MALSIELTGLTDLQWRAIYEFLNRYLVPNIVKEPGSPRGQIFKAYLEQINLVATGQLGIEDFLFNIGDIFPVAGEDNDRFRELAEQTQYNGFLKEFEEILNSEDPASAIQGLFDRYENAGIADNSIILGELDSFGGINSFSLMNPQNVLDRVLIGDNDWGVTVQMCTTTVTTNCVDPRAIKDIWEDFGRHVQVIFKGLEIPGLPDWLPLPGIMRLPTIGEIWDKISGPFNDAAREQMRDCMSKDDDGDGVANTASYCYENRDIAGIITQGILDGTGELVDATTEAVKGIVDKALEPLDCVTDPASCATKVKDTIEGIFGSADPTQPGLPDWMRVIIIGSQYGDEVLKELEKIFNEDIDGDGTIGITQEQFDCSTINRNGGIVEKEEDCGACLPNFTEVDGQCTDWTDTGATAEECAAENREHIPSTGAGTDSKCGGCLPDFQVNETGDCVASPVKCEGNQVLNETTGECEDPPPDCTPGGPCTDETGASGTYDENCDCVADWINSGPTEQDCAALGKTHVPADDSTQTPSSCGSCEQEGWTDTGASGECEAPWEDTGPTEEECVNQGKTFIAGDPETQTPSKCGDAVIWDGKCESGAPDAAQSFEHQAAYRAWAEQCGQTHCTDGSLIESHVNNDCQLGLTSDCQDPQTDEQKRNCGWQECGTETANPGLLVESLDQCGTPVEECSDPNRQKNNDLSCGDACNSGFDQPEGYDVCTSIAQLCADGAEGYGPDNELCGTTNGCPSGQAKFDGTNCEDPCPTDPDIGVSDPLCGTTVEKCNDPNAVNNGEDGPCECKPGFTKDAEGLCFQSGEVCDNGATEESGCNTCPDGTSVIEYEDGMCPGPVTTCDNGATDFPACTTCPEGQSMDAEGNCVTTTETCTNGATDYPACTTCPEGQSMDENGACVGDGDGGGTTGGGGSGGGGGGGMFDIKPITISGDPQLLSRTEFPITDFLAGLFTGSGGGRA